MGKHTNGNGLRPRPSSLRYRQDLHTRGAAILRRVLPPGERTHVLSPSQLSRERNGNGHPNRIGRIAELFLELHALGRKRSDADLILLWLGSLIPEIWSDTPRRSFDELFMEAHLFDVAEEPAKMRAAISEFSVEELPPFLAALRDEINSKRALLVAGQQKLRSARMGA